MGDNDVKKEEQPKDVANRPHITTQEELADQVPCETDHDRDESKQRELENAGGRVLDEADKKPQ